MNLKKLHFSMQRKYESETSPRHHGFSEVKSPVDFVYRLNRLADVWRSLCRAVFKTFWNVYATSKQLMHSCILNAEAYKNRSPKYNSERQSATRFTLIIFHPKLQESTIHHWCMRIYQQQLPAPPNSATKFFGFSQGPAEWSSNSTCTSSITCHGC